jgi:hypothetical protein
VQVLGQESHVLDQQLPQAAQEMQRHGTFIENRLTDPEAKQEH